MAPTGCEAHHRSDDPLGQRLTVEIEDDGIGAAADMKPRGVGLASVAEWATELGG
jgi:glucose-6-phosphate-specific signal transduction histidine kinase